MARLVFPSDRLVYQSSTYAGTAFTSAAGLTATVYADSAGTQLADVQNFDGSANAAATFTVDATSRLPLFLGPAAGTDTLYAQVGSGPVTPVYAVTAGDISAAVATEVANRTAAVTTETSRAQTAEALKAPLASPAFTGTPTKGGSPLLSQADASGAYAPAAYFRQIAGGGTFGPAGINTILGAAENAIASDVSCASILGGGGPGWENVIGGSTYSVNDAGVSNLPTATGTGADYATILGGYDNVNNGLASIIASYHSYIQTGVTHSAILGGSQHHIDAGFYQLIAGGTQNAITSTGNQNTIVGGTLNTITGTHAGAFVFGGASNTATNDYSIAGGFTCTASNIGALAMGYRNTASGTYSVAMGRQSTAYLASQRSYSGGAFTNNGDSQISDIHMRKVTTDATQSSMTLDNGAALPVLPDNTAWTFRATVVGATAGSAKVGGYESVGVIKRGSGVATTALVGTPTVTTYGETDATWDGAIQADTGTGSLKVRVQGAAGDTVHWTGRLALTEVTF